MDWIISLGDHSVTAFNRDGLYIAVTAMLIGTGSEATAAKVLAARAEEEARLHQRNRMNAEATGPLSYRIDLADGRFILIASSY